MTTAKAPKTPDEASTDADDLTERAFSARSKKKTAELLYPAFYAHQRAEKLQAEAGNLSMARHHEWQLKIINARLQGRVLLSSTSKYDKKS